MKLRDGCPDKNEEHEQERERSSFIIINRSVRVNHDQRRLFQKKTSENQKKCEEIIEISRQSIESVDQELRRRSNR